MWYAEYVPQQEANTLTSFPVTVTPRWEEASSGRRTAELHGFAADLDGTDTVGGGTLEIELWHRTVDYTEQTFVAGVADPEQHPDHPGPCTPNPPAPAGWYDDATWWPSGLYENRVGEMDAGVDPPVQRGAYDEWASDGSSWSWIHDRDPAGALEWEPFISHSVDPWAELTAFDDAMEVYATVKVQTPPGATVPPPVALDDLAVALWTQGGV